MPEKVFGIGATVEAAIAQAITANALRAPLRFQVLEQQGEWDGRDLRFTVKLLVWRA